MNKYDILFVGHMASGRIEPFGKPPELGHGGGAFFGAMAARCITKQLAVVTRIAEENRDFLEPLDKAGIDVYAQQSAQTTHMRVVYLSANVDERQLYLVRSAGFYRIEEMPAIEPCLIHLGGLSDQEFTLDFMRGLKERGFRLSLDMQSFVFRVDRQSGLITLQDVPEKGEILQLVDVVKLDVAEAKALTGTDDLPRAAAAIAPWGCSEVLITRSDGVLAYRDNKIHFAKFTNRTVEGRTGRGDTTMGAYLARRMEHSVEDSVKFAAALASIKMEAPAPFTGSLEDVLERMRTSPAPP
jgi:sugar/nucleoside kinase (ribokinase family)